MKRVNVSKDLTGLARAYRQRRLEESFAPGFAAFLDELPVTARERWKQRCAKAAGATALEHVPSLVVMRDTRYRVGDERGYSLACRWQAPIAWRAA